MGNTHTSIHSRSPFYSGSPDSNNVKAQKDSNTLTQAKSYDKLSSIEIPRGLDDITDENGNPKKINIGKLPSSKNPYFNLRLKTTGEENYPVSDAESAERPELYETLTEVKLIESPRGASIYSADDFLYCSKYSELPLNRLITLRRFAYPTFDDIFSKTSQSEPDIARMLCYFDQDTNKLSDILQFSFGMNWRDLESASEQASMEGSQNGISGIVGKALRFVDPKFGQEAIRGTNAVNYNPQHDSNRVYGPVDSISKAKIRNIGLNFEQEMTLEFDYKMQSINGVNQKAAFIDLLSNVILMCTNNGEFWGGSRYWVGPQPSKYMNDMKALSPANWNDFVSKSTEGMKSFLQTMSSKTDAKETLKKIANNALNLALGKILNTLGRPGIPVMNSLLTGTPIGPWHITVGNPYNPILVAGDLVITNSTIAFGDELGYDDFPTTFKATITLSHSKPRDRGGIESMFNAGKGRTYLKPESIDNNSYIGRELVRSVTPEAKSLTELVSAQKASNLKFGEYTKSDIERNKDAVWSFVKTEK